MVVHLAANQKTCAYFDSRHKILQTSCLYTYFTLIPADIDKENQAQEHDSHPPPTFPTSSVYSWELQGEKKEKGTF